MGSTAWIRTMPVLAPSRIICGARLASACVADRARQKATSKNKPSRRTLPGYRCRSLRLLRTDEKRPHRLAACHMKINARMAQRRIHAVPEPLRNSAAINSATAGARARTSSTTRHCCSSRSAASR
jgi:hypothetical protein